MSGCIITLTTDFGTVSPYVSAMKGVLLGINPDARLIDLTHDVPPQNIVHAGFFLAGAVPFFPRSAIHLVVVDPGVGSSRAILCIELAGHVLVGPDNGFWCVLGERLAARPNVYRVDTESWRLLRVSNTFHGRDLMAPVAARLSLGFAPESVGEHFENWCRLDQSRAQRTGGEINGKIIFVDGFGNLITNIRADDIEQISNPVEIVVGDKIIRGIMRTYSDVKPGEPLALLSSFDLLEIAVCCGNAELLFSAGVGACVILRGTV